MSCYVDLTVDVKKLLQFDKIKEVSDPAKAILPDGMDFGYKKMLYKQNLMERAMHFKLTKQAKIQTKLSYLITILQKGHLFMSITLPRVTRRWDEI